MAAIRRSGTGRGARGARIAVLLGAGLWLAFAAGGARPAVAQESLESVRAFIDRTADILDQVGEAVRESESDRARRVFQEARTLHEQSRRLLGDGRPLLAMRVARQARATALSAGRLARTAQTLEERARMRLERLQELRETLRERAGEGQSAEIGRFLREAERQLERAREQYAQKNFEIAFNLLGSAEALFNRAARLLFEQGGAARLENELEQTAVLIDRSREQARDANDRAALDGVERAQAELDRARDAARAGEPWRALRFAGQARRLAAQAAERLDAGVSPAAVQELIVRWDERRTLVDDAARRAGDRRALAIVDQATGHRRRAGELLDGGRVEEALRQITLAHDLLSKAAERTR
jgi:tetratricopeptide (TPR) repeat protein